MLDDGSIDFTSSSGLSPWSTQKAGAIELPVIAPPTTQPTTAPSVMASPLESGESILLPCDRGVQIPYHAGCCATGSAQVLAAHSNPLRMIVKHGSDSTMFA